MTRNELAAEQARVEEYTRSGKPLHLLTDRQLRLGVDALTQDDPEFHALHGERWRVWGVGGRRPTAARAGRGPVGPGGGMILSALHLVVELFCVALIVGIGFLLLGGPLFPPEDVEYVRGLDPAPADAVTDCAPSEGARWLRSAQVAGCTSSSTAT